MRLVLRVDDVAQDVTQAEPDRGLRTFLRWWDAGGWAGLPAVLGVVPAALDADAWRALHGLAAVPGVELALHGWDHAPGPLTPEHVRRGARAFADHGFPVPRCQIPPDNKYSPVTLAAVRLLHDRPVLLGGFQGEHHDYGLAPRVVDGVLHLAASRTLYAHAYRLADAISGMPEPRVHLWNSMDEPECPRVLTLHHRWDVAGPDFPGGLRRLRDLVADSLVGLDEAWGWVASQGMMTAGEAWEQKPWLEP
jgi:hypothetical protein